MPDELLPPMQADVPVAEPIAAPDPFVTVEFTKGAAEEWKSRISGAIKLQETYHPWWTASLKNYAPQVSENPSDYALKVRTNRSFTIVERKNADLFYANPEVTLDASPLIEGMPDGARMTSAHATILAYKLGLFGVNAKKVAGDALFANELFGAGPTKVFYRAYKKDLPQPVRDSMGQPVMEPDPLTGLPTTTPKMEIVPVVIYSECGWESFSNKQWLIPDDFRSTDFDKAPWQGMLFTMNARDARNQWPGKIPDDFNSTGNNQGTVAQQYFSHGGTQNDNAQPSKDIVTGKEIYYRSMLFRDDVLPHPEHLTKIVFIDGINEPVEHRDSPDQTFDAQGQITPNSMIGYPYHPILTRTLTDSAYVMSDVAIALPITNEMDKFRDQCVIQRQINLLKWFYDTGKLDKAALDKSIQAMQGGMVGLPSDAFADPNGPIRAFPTSAIPQDSYALDSILDRDLDETFAIDGPAAGATDESATATASNISQANRNVRTGKEQSAVADWYIRLVGKFSSLIQRYMSVEEAAAIVGQEQAMAWDRWRKTIPTRLAFKMTPDSSLRNDTPLERKQLQDLYSYMANDPALNRRYLSTKLLEKSHIDPTRALLAPDQIPPPKKEDPRVSFAVSGEDVSPLSPQSPIILDILAKLGVEIDPNAMLAAQVLGGEVAHMIVQKNAADAAAKAKPGDTQHGGKVPQIEGLSKHAADLTGGMDGSGALSPGMSPMGVQ